MKIKVNKEIAGYKPDTIVSVDEKDVQSRLYWNRRLEDAKIDFCCEKIEEITENKNVVQSKNKNKKEITN